MQIAVYCGSKSGYSTEYIDLATNLGQQMARRQHDLIYGGANIGLMGAVADAVLAGGRQVLGVMPKALVDREVAHPGITELQVVDTMHERKAGMADPADAFVALPGGPGTMEELFEVWTWQMLGYHNKPVAILNHRGYYDPLLTMITRMTEQGFAWADLTTTLIIESTVDSLLTTLESQVRPQ
ncbi:TIGR00730 family Rossman fold protein [Saccharospirillum alexandrii]|uniref:LOG family protein n=1 Tax=Saccharospirillum alexandrii TaxID=2448477 RepID=UPI000FDB7D99|nr:TIGR00730 family Rossman fold protein [Saccharospirillum alexandrii]